MKIITDSTPKQDGYRMPGEFEPRKQDFLIWPERQDTWRNGGKPARPSSWRWRRRSSSTSR